MYSELQLAAAGTDDLGFPVYDLRGISAQVLSTLLEALEPKCVEMQEELTYLMSCHGKTYSMIEAEATDPDVGRSNYPSSTLDGYNIYSVEQDAMFHYTSLRNMWAIRFMIKDVLS